jgi:hypothetical protein
VTGFWWGVLGFFGGLGVTAFGDLVSEEVRDRLDHLPHAILRLAARRLAPMQRAAIYQDEWLPELTYILRGDQARPITRLYHGTGFALGIAFSVRRIGASLKPELSAQGSPAGQESSDSWLERRLAAASRKAMDKALRRRQDMFAEKIMEGLREGYKVSERDI